MVIFLLALRPIAGIIKASALQYSVIRMLEIMNMPAFVLAPLAGILMATASTTAGATVVDSLPHGSFFHATGGAVNMTIEERMKPILFEACIGLTSTIVSVVIFLI